MLKLRRVKRMQDDDIYSCKGRQKSRDCWNQSVRSLADVRTLHVRARERISSASSCSYLPFRRVRLRPYSHRQDIAPWKCSQPADQPASCLSSIESFAYIRHDCYDWRSSKIRIYILYFRRNVCVVEIKSRFIKINSFRLAAEGENMVNCHDMLLRFMIFSRMIVDDISFSLYKLIPCP